VRGEAFLSNGQGLEPAPAGRRCAARRTREIYVRTFGRLDLAELNAFYTAGLAIRRNRILEVAMKVSAKKTQELNPDQILVATQDFATQSRVVHRGERVRATDPVVGDGRWFVPEETPESERPNFWHDLPAPPPHTPSVGFDVSVGSIEIPVHRRVVARESLWFQGTWAPGSIGEQRQRRGDGPPPPTGSTLPKGAVRDIADPVVRSHLQWFEWPARPVSIEDVERMTNDE
jgi:hypothetical protein